MKFVYPEIDYVFDTDSGKVNTLVIENPKFLVSLLSDIEKQLRGEDGLSVLSDEGKILSVEKYCELLSEFVPFRINSKTLSTKVASSFEKSAMLEEHYMETMNLLSMVEAYFIKLSLNYNCDFVFPKLNISSLTKAAGIEINEEYDSLGEKIADYFEFVSEFDRKKLYFTLNLRSFIDDDESGKFIDTVLRHGYNLIMIESCEHRRLPDEERIIVDDSLCIIK